VADAAIILSERSVSDAGGGATGAALALAAGAGDGGAACAVNGRNVRRVSANKERKRTMALASRLVL